MITKRIQQLSPSATLEIDRTVKQLQRSGKTIFNLSIGEPDFDTPKYIQTAGIEAIKSGFTHYTEASGIVELKEAIAKKLKTDNDLSYDTSEILVGAGSKHILYHAFQVLVEKGDEVIVTLPTWNTYIEQIKLAGGKAKLIKLIPPFIVTAAQIEKKITRKTKLILLNSPANPTGAMIPKSELEKIATLAKKYNLIIISDEIYEKILYSEQHVSVASLSKDSRERTLLINGFSKAYAMTGWRIGYVAGPKEIISAMAKLQGQTTSNPSSISQKAALAAISFDDGSISKMRDEFEKRKQFLEKGLSKLGIEFASPQGAFYIFISVEKFLGKKYKTAMEFCTALLTQQQVALVPGEAFFYPGYVRISFAASKKDLEESLLRLERFLNE